MLAHLKTLINHPINLNHGSKNHWISSINWCRRKALTIWQGSLVIGRFPPCDNYLTQRCQLAPTWCQSAYKMGDDIYLLGSSSPLVVSIILSVCPSLINRCPPWATKLLTNPTLACRHFSIHMNVAVEVIWSGSATGGLCTHIWSDIKSQCI